MSDLGSTHLLAEHRQVFFRRDAPAAVGVEQPEAIEDHLVRYFVDAVRRIRTHQSAELGKVELAVGACGPGGLQVGLLEVARLSAGQRRSGRGER